MYVQYLHPIFPEQTLAQLTQFGGRPQPDGTYVLHPVNLHVRACRRVVFGYGDVLAVETANIIEQAVA